MLCLWSEDTYRIQVDDCANIEVADFNVFHNVLIEEAWHPAAQRTDGYWFGPCPHTNSKLHNIFGWLTPRPLLVTGYPRSRSPSSSIPVFVPSISTYLDAIIYHVTRYKESRRGLWAESSSQLRTLTRYLYLELPHQQSPLLIELEEAEFMEEYLPTYVRKPYYIYQDVPGEGFTAIRVEEWTTANLPDSPKKIFQIVKE